MFAYFMLPTKFTFLCKVIVSICVHCRDIPVYIRSVANEYKRNFIKDIFIDKQFVVKKKNEVMQKLKSS